MRNSSRKAKRSKRLLPAAAEREFGVRVQQVNYLQEKKNSSEEVNGILRIYNLHHKHPAYIKNHMTCKERRNVPHSQEEEQSKETDPQDNQATGISRKDILREVKTIFKDHDSRAMTRSLCYTHEALTSLAPHERLPELPVIPREKPHTGAADRENPRDAPVFAT